MSLVDFQYVKELLDAAADGTVTVGREGERFAVVDADRLRYFLVSIGPRARVVSEDGGWALFFPGLPLAAEGDTFDDMLDDAVVVLREYADDWTKELHLASNHTNNWGLVQLVCLSSDDELRAWLTGLAGDLARSES